MLQANQDSSSKTQCFLGMLFACGLSYSLEVFSNIAYVTPSIEHLWSLPGLIEWGRAVVLATSGSSLAYVGLLVVSFTAVGRAHKELLQHSSPKERQDYERLLQMILLLRIASVVLLFVSAAIPIDERVLNGDWLPVVQSCFMLLTGSKVLGDKMHLERRLLG